MISYSTSLNLSFIILGIIVGYLIAWLCKDELIEGRRYFRVLIIASIIVGIYSYLTGFIYLFYTTTVIFITSLISFIKSYDSKFALVRFK